MDRKLAMIGKQRDLLGFNAAGIDVFEAEPFEPEGKNSLSALLSRLEKEEYGILFITEDLIAENPSAAAAYKSRMLPAIVPIPGRSGTRGIGMENIHKNVERAVGTDLFQNEEKSR